MIPLAGILIVFAAVAGGYLIESGDPGILAQPAELLIILGSALGAMLAANPISRLARIARTLGKIFGAPGYTTDRYLAMLVMLHSVFQFARRQGGSALENAVDNPGGSPLFAAHANALANREALDFVCDTLRISSLGTVAPYHLEIMLDNDLELRRREAFGPVESLETLADSLPGFGIAAAVLGVILAMGSLKDSPLQMGIKIASALVGTFTGILLAYGVVSPVAARIAKIEDAESTYFEAIKAGLASFAKGMPPSIAVECARRAIPTEIRPDFEKTVEACRRGAIHTPAKSSVLK